jgi:hypothetical protein
MAFRTSSSEFPNANFELHDGAIWICVRPAGRVQPVVRPPSPGADELKSERQPLAESVAPPRQAKESIEEEPDDYPRLVEALAAVLLEAGATRAAACLRPLLDGDGVESTAIGLENAPAKGMIVRAGSRIELSPSALSTARAWRAALSGSDDLSACESTLDAWCADLLGSLSGIPCDQLRRSVRGRGVAAFGLAQAA